jgi:GTP cyclohydrolase II
MFFDARCLHDSCMVLSFAFEARGICMSDVIDSVASPSTPPALPPLARKATHIRLTSHPAVGGTPVRPIEWGAADPLQRGPIIGSTTNKRDRNVIGTHSGSYGIYRALAMAAGTLDRDRKADLTNTMPTDVVGPYPSWVGNEKIVSLDPWGGLIANLYKADIEKGIDVRPTIAVTKAHVDIPEIRTAIALQRLKPDGKILLANGSAVVTKAAVEPVWWLPGVAKRFGCGESDLRRVLFEETGGMYPELVTRSDMEVFLPPIGSQTVYVFGDIKDLANPNVKLTARIHDECNGSDVFGSDICTCRPYLTHAIEECIRGAQEGGVGLVIYCRKEGRALGEVTKFLVYNARKRQVGGDSAEKYFLRTECVAGVQDMRFQELMPDIFHWLGITRIHRLVSMSNMKYDAIVGSGIAVDERVPIPDDMIPADAQVEMQAKMAAGYFTPSGGPDPSTLRHTVGREFES